ncbi:type II toxin-antitoxin system RelE/ParE family toxin [Leucobacter viscericola]|uniref:Type II toxin-antitoxin system RelE/ParE family toxin n=1 Tax=Leucobacter viscericola TaxID=2714935 RepID=A0A6G7XFU2_9MICO|nr:type II toxin-antitoxin system RelE/ParE family toxin [Leucobacter viscericola]
MIPGTRELFPVKQYRLVYETTKDKIWVLAIVHTSQRWPAP